jgi:formylglycine-generating enzyme required for sulfatase activity
MVTEPQASPPNPVSGTPRTIQGWVQDTTSLLTGLIALVAVFGTFVEKAQQWVPWLTPSSRPYLLGLAFLAFTATFYLQRSRLLRISEIKVPDALILRGQLLVGRKDDVQNLTSLLTDSAVVWLIGESGSGKSTLLQNGLQPTLKQDPARLVVYIDVWGADWAKGPPEALLDAIRRSGQETITAANLFDKLAVIKEETGRLPVLLFDQFDDYQVRHRSKFISSRGSFISVKALVQKNPFWQQIELLLREGRIHCLFVTRNDSVGGMQCVRFQEPQVYPLDRLRKGHALPLLEDLSAGNVVSHPEAGWQELSRQVCSDLESDGNLLPIQMRVVFRSLAGLRPLTKAAYRRQGGLRGLEAANINYHVTESARYSGFAATEILQLLMRMVDAKVQRTIPAPEQLLLNTLPEAKREPDKLLQLLGNLADKEIVRKRIDPDTGASVWLLDHDYLCRGVLELERRANYWAYVLDDALNTFNAASGPWETWKALLGPWIQIRLWCERLRGRMVYGGARRFMLLSLFRTVVNLPFVALVLAVFALLTWVQQSRRNAEIAEESNTDSYRQKLESQATGLWPGSPDKIPATTKWLALAKPLQNKMLVLNERLKRINPNADEFRKISLDRIVKSLDSFTELIGRVTDLRASEQVTLDYITAHPAQGIVDDITRDVNKFSLGVQWPTVHDERLRFLVPLGPDPDSRLAEFAYVLSGEIPIRGQDGKLLITDKSSLVFVLIPGGSFFMGAQRSNPRGLGFDPDSKEDEKPLRLITLAPFLLSKYEMTQGQWLRTTGRSPTGEIPIFQSAGEGSNLSYPVNTVSWNTFSAVLRPLGMDFPTEAQWEYSARAGSNSVRWNNLTFKSFAQVANVRETGNLRPTIVGSYPPNKFGLHDMIGNVWEFCRDLAGPVDSMSSLDGERLVHGSNKGRRTDRGGSYFDDNILGRPTAHYEIDPDYKAFNLGVRPIIDLFK